MSKHLQVPIMLGATAGRFIDRQSLQKIILLSYQKRYVSNKRSRRVVVTGLGCLSPVGFNVEESWKTIIGGGCGIRKLGKEYSRLPCTVAAIIPHGRGGDNSTLDLTKHFPKSSLRTMALSTAYAVLATNEALADANWIPKDEGSLRRTGVAVGVGMLDLQEVCNTNAAFKMGYSRISPYFMARILPNMAAGHISMKYGFKGPIHTVSTACTTGAHSIGDAFRFVRCGDADVMICGGAEASICPLSVAAFCRLRALSTTKNDDPTKASRPFDRDRDGFVMGDGAAVLILEELQHAIERKAHIYAEVLGYGLSSDGTQLAAQVEDANGATLSMTRALEDAHLKPEEVGYVNAHAPSTRMGDAIEAKAVKKVFGDHSKNLYMSSTKGAHGHLLGAAGNMESIFAVKSVKTGLIPPTINLTNPSEELDLNFVPKTRAVWTTEKRKIVLKNSFGFAGSNATLIFAEYIPENTRDKKPEVEKVLEIIPDIAPEYRPSNFSPSRKHLFYCDIEN